MLRNHQSYLDGVFDGLIREVNRLIRQVITDHLMTLHLSSTEVLRLGRDLTGTFPQVLEQIDNARLREMLARIDVTPDSLKQSGAKDWANFTDRMHFIADFFRVYQEQRHLFDAPVYDPTSHAVKVRRTTRWTSVTLHIDEESSAYPASASPLWNNASQGEAFFSVYRGAFPYRFLTKPFSRSSPRTTGEKTRFSISG